MSRTYTRIGNGSPLAEVEKRWNGKIEKKERENLEQDFFILCRRFDQTGLYPGKYAELQLTKLLNLQAEYEKLYHDFVDLWEEVQTGKTVLPKVKA